MPYLLLMGPSFSFEQRKIMAFELTDAILSALRLPEASRDWITIQFLTYRGDQLSVGGRLLSEIEEPNYYCQFFDIKLTQEKRERMITTIFPLLMETLGLTSSQATQIKILFQDCAPENVVIGGHFVTEYLAALR